MPTYENLLNALRNYASLSQLDSYASIIGLLITIYVALSLRSIRRTYIFRVRAPEFIRVLTKHASTLVSFGNDFDNSKEKINVQLAISDVKLRYMQRRMRRGEAKRTIKQLRILMKTFTQNEGNRDQFYLIYTQMQRVVAEVKELQKELDLE